MAKKKKPIAGSDPGDGNGSSDTQSSRQGVILMAGRDTKVNPSQQDLAQTVTGDQEHQDLERLSARNDDEYTRDPLPVGDSVDHCDTSIQLEGAAQTGIVPARTSGPKRVPAKAGDKDSGERVTNTDDIPKEIGHADNTRLIGRTKGGSILPVNQEDPKAKLKSGNTSVTFNISKNGDKTLMERGHVQSQKALGLGNDEILIEDDREVIVNDCDVLSDADIERDGLTKGQEEALIAGQPATEFPELGAAGPPEGVRQAWKGNSSKIFMNSGLGGRLEYTPPTSSRIAIKCSEGMPKSQVWGSSLLGQYVGFYPGFFAINNVIKSWEVKVKFRMEAGWMIFSFLNDDDRDRVLRGGPYFIFNRPLLLKHVPDKFAFNQKDIATMPLWVRITGLPNEFWTPTILGRIGSLIGKPLFMDHVTEDRKRGSYARVLIEVNFAKDILREVSLDFDDGVSLDCTLLYENEPQYCRKCLQFGHKDVDCAFNERSKDVGVKPVQVRRRQGNKDNNNAGKSKVEGAASVHGTVPRNKEQQVKHGSINMNKTLLDVNVTGGTKKMHLDGNVTKTANEGLILDKSLTDEERRKVKGKAKVDEGTVPGSIHEPMQHDGGSTSEDTQDNDTEEGSNNEEDSDDLVIQSEDEQSSGDKNDDCEASDDF